MISTELWRARIGLFNCKRCSSVSSSFSSCRRSYYYNRLRRRHGPGTVVSSSTDGFSLVPPNTSSMAVSSRLSTSSLLLAVPVVMSIAPHCAREHTTITTLLDSDGSHSTSHSSSSLKTNPASSSTTSITSSDSSTVSHSSKCSSFSFACLTDKFTMYPMCCSLICDMILSMLVIEIISLLLIICGDVETNPGPVASDKPTSVELIVLKKSEGPDLRIIDWITSFERSRCENLAHLLLKNDVQVQKLLKIINTDEFVSKVLEKWLALDDDDPNCKAVPRTWEDLAKCVTDCGPECGALAKAIRDTCPQTTGTGPTVLEIKTMKGADGKPLNIVQKIAAGDYMTFGMCLLQDENGHEVELIEKNYCQTGVERFALAILTKWLTSGAAPTRTYQHLIECLRQSDLGALADNIANTTEAHETLSPPPTKKTKPQPADPITRYAKYLKYRYRQPLPDDDKLPAAPSKYYIELAVINSENISRKEADEFTRKTLHGLTEEVMCKKTPIALENILKPGEDGKPVRCVLVEGAPGAGKSMLAWELCHRWEELECVRQYDLVVLVQLRGKRAQEATCLSDLLPKSSVNTEELLASIGNGKGTLLVLDGFDELPLKQREENSLYIDLIKGAPDMLPEATVVVTSRPSVSAELFTLCKHNIDRHLEVLGFTPEQIDEYARSVFSESKEFDAFMQYIDSNPVIKGMMYLPLNAVIVASIFKNSYGADCPSYPIAMTQLYDALTRSLIRRHLVDKKIVPKHYCMPQSLQCRESINKLPPSVADQLLVVARVAYKGLCDGRYVFTDLGVEFDNLGMMKKATSLDVSIGPTCSFSFFHLTLQEYLSALYISLELHSGLEVPFSISEKNMVIRFLAGLCKHGDQTLSHILDDLLQKIVHFRAEFLKLLVVQCVYECAEIVQTIEMIRNFFTTKLIYVNPFTLLSPFDYYFIGHCIKLIGGRWSIGISTKEEVEFLMLGAGSDGHEGKVQALDILSSPLLTFDPLLKLFRRDLCCLAFHIKFITDSDVTRLQEYISPGRGITRVKFSGPIFINKSWLATVFGRSSLESLQLSSHRLITNTETLNIPSDKSNLKKLTIDTRFGGIDVFKQLAPTLRKCMSLSYLYLLYHPPSKCISGLVTLHHGQPVNKHPLASLVPTLIEILLSNHTLQQVTVSYYVVFSSSYLPEEDVKAMVQLVEVAAHSTSLKKLSCDSLLFSQVKAHIPEQYRNILYELDDQSWYRDILFELDDQSL